MSKQLAEYVISELRQARKDQKSSEENSNMHRYYEGKVAAYETVILEMSDVVKKEIKETLTELNTQLGGLK